MVDEKLFGRYEASLLACTDLTKLEVEALLKDLDGLTPQQKAARLLLDYPGIVQKYGIVASELTRQWYQQARDRHFEDDEDAEAYEAEAAQPLQRGWAEEDVQKASANGLGNLTGMAVNRVMGRADQTMAYNVQNDPARPCWAIVPNFGACGFCVMVGSNGFYMKRQPVKVRRHDHCRCTVVADWDTKNPHLDGYDPDRLYEAYHEADLSTRAYVDRAWERMTQEERERYKRKGRSAKDVFRTKVVSKEIKRRDPAWVQDGKPVRVDYSEKPRSAYGVFKEGAADYRRESFASRGNEWKDLFIHDSLSRSGFFTYAHETIARGGHTNIDADVQARRCEFKSPEAKPKPESKDELRFVQKNVQSARHQFVDDATLKGGMRMVMSNYYTGFSGDDEMRVFERFCRELEYQGFAEGLFIKKDGTVLRAKQ